MAKFKERMKMIFNNKLTRAIIVIFMCIVGMSVLGRCSTVEATNFTLSDSSVSNITYNENQMISGIDSNGVTYYLVINSPDNTNYIITYYSNSMTQIYNNCTYNTNYNRLQCKYGTYINYNDTKSTNFTNYMMPRVFVISQNTVTLYNNAMSMETPIIDFNQIVSEYNKGLEDGYNNGYVAGQNAGYNTGYTEGANSVDITQDNEQAIEDYITENNYHTDEEYNSYGESQYNKGYDDGESEGFINGSNANIEQAYSNGYNYGYNQGYTSGMSDADNRVNTSSQSYIVGFSAGVGSVDITADNGDAIVNYITSNNYHTDSDYLNYGKAQYTSGYNEGQYTMINSVINNANEKYKTNITNVCSDDKSKCNTFIESTNKNIYDKGYNDRDITTDNYKAIQTYLSDNNLYTQKQYEDFGYNKYLEGAETAEGYNIGYEEGYKEGQTDAEVSILEFFPGIIGAIIGFFITLMQITIFGVSLFDIVGILFGIGLIILILKVMNGGGD